jgi:16S rRNA (adenine1518-N6/adenine1519-N6)-dimethyltransferase
MSGFEDPRVFLGRHELRPKDSFGQNFLVAPSIAESIVRALAARTDETVVEIGTGTGTLAKMLAPTVKQVLAIERDRDLVKALAQEALAPNIAVLEQDAAAFDYSAQCDREPTVIVGNLPYQITGKLLRAITTHPIRWRVAVVMVQREVGARLCARVGDDDWGVLTVFAQAGCTVKKICDASPGCFFPQPRVVSSVLLFTPRAVPLAIERPALQKVVHALFAARRKTLLNGLTPIAPRGREQAKLALERCSIDPQRRAETLEITDLDRITKALLESELDRTLDKT